MESPPLDGTRPLGSLVKSGLELELSPLVLLDPSELDLTHAWFENEIEPDSRGAPSEESTRPFFDPSSSGGRVDATCLSCALHTHGCLGRNRVRQCHERSGRYQLSIRLF
jgi:hypothetical protein